jgi:UDP-N-acetyl-2-amino-2-deoxyglucuronate dehydrogenase
MSAPVGIGFVGGGGIFEQHARALADLGGRARITGLTEVDLARRFDAAARHGIPWTSGDHRQLVTRSDVDLVCVCTPPVHHEAAVVDALRAGRRVVCEKPLAPTLEAADRILAVAREHPGNLAVVHQFRWLPAVRRAVWLRDTGRLGDLLTGRFFRYARFRRPGKADRPGWWGSWEVAGGGVVMTQLIHELDLMCHLFGRPVHVLGSVDTLHEDIPSEDACCAVVRFAGGALVSAQATMSAHRSTAGFEVIGTRGSAHGPWAFEALERDHRAEGRSAAIEAVPDPPEFTSDHTPFLAAVLDALQADAPLPSPGEESRASLELAAAIYAAGLSDAPVELPLGPGDAGYAGVSAAEWQARGRAPVEV